MVEIIVKMGKQEFGCVSFSICMLYIEINVFNQIMLNVRILASVYDWWVWVDRLLTESPAASNVSLIKISNKSLTGKIA